MSSTCAFLFLTFVGISLAAESPFIQGSGVTEVADIRYKPWQGSVYEGFNFVCGCSLISKEWAVTAASCVQNPPYNVKFGSLDRTEGMGRTVQEIVYHENFTITESYYYRYNDIALLKFDRPLSLSFTMSNIKLSDGGENCQKYFFTGWGLTNDGEDFQPWRLHQATVKVVSNAVCQNGSWPDIDESHVCTDTVYRSSPTPCWGDTGGPLVCLDLGQPKLFGISSWQLANCGSNDYPVYTRVSYFRQWIKDKIDV